MAGNIVKWWKHKILGGYKQFSGKFPSRLFPVGGTEENLGQESR